MSVAGYNKFALLNEDDEGVKSGTPPKGKGNATSPAQPAEPAKSQQPKGGPASRSGRYYARGGGPKPQGDSAPAEESNIPTQRFDRTEGRPDRGRGSDRGRGRGEGGRGRGRGRGGYKDDRHSKTGITDSSKQTNQGWGANEGNAELAAESAAEKDVQAETKEDAGATWGEETPGASWGATDGAAPADGDAAAATAGEGEKTAPPAPEEDKTMTLDEYLAKRTDGALTGLIGSIQPRKANEGAGEDLFAGAQQVLREQNEEAEFYSGKTKAQKSAKPKEVKEKITIEIDGQFADSNDRGGRGRGRGRGGGRGDFRGGDFRGGESRGGDFRGDFRGGRGGERGRGGRGGRGRGGGQQGLNVDDQKAFPSLS